MALTAVDTRPAWQRAMDASAAKWRQQDVSRLPPPWRNAEARSYALRLCGIFWPDEIEATSIAGRRRVVERLGQALIIEHSRSRSNHWAYALPRHRHLLSVYKRELADLQALETSRMQGRRAAA